MKNTFIILLLAMFALSCRPATNVIAETNIITWKSPVEDGDGFGNYYCSEGYCNYKLNHGDPSNYDTSICLPCEYKVGDTLKVQFVKRQPD